MTEYGLRRRDGQWWVGNEPEGVQHALWTKDINSAKRFETAAGAAMEALNNPRAIGIDWNWKPLPNLPADEAQAS